MLSQVDRRCDVGGWSHGQAWWGVGSGGGRGLSTSGVDCTSNLGRSDVQPTPFAQDEREVGAGGLVSSYGRRAGGLDVGYVAA